MKRTELVRHLAAHGCQLFREGGRHSIYWNPTNRKTSAVPRHTENIRSAIVDYLAVVKQQTEGAEVREVEVVV